MTTDDGKPTIPADKAAATQDGVAARRPSALDPEREADELQLSRRPRFSIRARIILTF